MKLKSQWIHGALTYLNDLAFRLRQYVAYIHGEDRSIDVWLGDFGPATNELHIVRLYKRNMSFKDFGKEVMSLRPLPLNRKFIWDCELPSHFPGDKLALNTNDCISSSFERSEEVPYLTKCNKCHEEVWFDDAEYSIELNAYLCTGCESPIPHGEYFR